MKTKRKALLLALCAVLLVAASVFGTMAYLTSTDKVTNTFTVGKVKITLDETDVDQYGVPEPNAAERVKKNDYKLIPGRSYVKDPVVHVDSTSEPCYIRAIVTVSDIAKLKAAFPAAAYGEYYDNDVFLLEKLVTAWVPANWACVKATAAGEYEFRYVGPGTSNGVYTYVAPGDLPALFATIELPGSLDAGLLANLEDLEIQVVAHAIQADGFDDADAAWAAFAPAP